MVSPWFYSNVYSCIVYGCTYISTYIEAWKRTKGEYIKKWKVTFSLAHLIYTFSLRFKIIRKKLSQHNNLNLYAVFITSEVKCIFGITLKVLHLKLLV